MRFVSTGRNNAAAQDFRDDLGRFAGAIHAVVGKLVGRKALGVERSKAVFIAEKRAAGHGHTARKQNFDGRIQPENGNASGTQKFWATGLRVGAAAKSKNGAFFELRGATESSTELICFDLTKSGLTEAFENLWNREARGFLNAIIEIYKVPGELTREERADGGLTGTHETGEAKNRNAG